MVEIADYLACPSIGIWISVTDRCKSGSIISDGVGHRSQTKPTGDENLAIRGARTGLILPSTTRGYILKTSYSDNIARSTGKSCVALPIRKNNCNGGEGMDLNHRQCLGVTGSQMPRGRKSDKTRLTTCTAAIHCEIG
jgi:hypothetical protein